MVLDYKNFEEHINKIKKMYDSICKLDKCFRDIGWDATLFPEDGTDNIISLLEFIFHDEDHWIEYFCYDLDFGQDYEPGAVICNDKKVPLASIHDLYTFLLQNIEEELKNGNTNE